MSECVKTEFYQKHEEELRRILEKVKDELLQETAPFWTERVVDEAKGGYFNCFDRQGNRYDDKKCGWFVGRNMYMFSALCNEIGMKEEWFAAAEAGRKFMETKFQAEDGRFNYLMDGDGEVTEGITTIFTDHFAVKGLYEYILAKQKHAKSEEERREIEKDIAWAKELTEKLLLHVNDAEVLRSEGIEPGMQKHAVNFMTLIVFLEARKLFGTKYDLIVENCVHKSLYEFAHDELKAAFENVSADGAVVPRGDGRLMDAGHTMESLWFSMKAGLELKHPEYIKRAGEIVDWVIDRCYDEEFGGFYQYVDFENGVTEDEFLFNNYCEIPVAWNDKIWWVQAESLYTLAMSALLNENERHFTYFKKQLEYVEEFFRDSEYGEWYALRKRDGAMLQDDKGFQLKGPYHVPRCQLNLVMLLENYLNCK